MIDRIECYVTIGGYLLQNIETQPVRAPKLLFTNIEADRKLIRDAYTMLNLIQNRSPYNASVELTVERDESIYIGKLRVVSQGFEADIREEESCVETLLSSVKSIGLKKLKQWNRSRFNA